MDPRERALLERYLDLLLEANQRINLTSVRDRTEAWERHVLDSRTLLPMIVDLGSGARLIDVGSGGGLPGIPLAIGQPDLQVTLLEATAKKARFLEDCVRELALSNTCVLCERAETAARAPDHREAYDRATCRAVGPLREILEYSLPFLRIGGRLLAMKGAKAPEEVPAAATAARILGGGPARLVPAAASDAVIVVIEKVRGTPEEYPRPPGRARKYPL